MWHGACKGANAEAGSSPGILSAGMAQGILLPAGRWTREPLWPPPVVLIQPRQLPFDGLPLGKSHKSRMSRPEGRLPAPGTAQRLLGIFPARLQGRAPHIQTEGCRQTKTGRIALALPPGWLAAGPPVNRGSSSRPGMPPPRLWPWAGEGGRQHCGSGPAPSSSGSPGSCCRSGASSCKGPARRGRGARRGDLPSPGGVLAAWSSFQAPKNPTPEMEERTGRGPTAPRHMEGSLSFSHLSPIVGLRGKPPDAMADDRPESQAPSCDCVAAGGLMKPNLGLGGCCKQRKKTAGWI